MQPDGVVDLGPSPVQMQWGVTIPLRDGVHLSATLYLPSNHSVPTAAIFTLTPYVAQVSHDVAVYFAAHGLPFLTVDMRGRGNAEGLFKANGSEAKDAYDIVEWLAKQPYCNGRVSMWGGSYAGYVQWAAAKEFPAHLATIVPVASPYRGVDSPAPHNIFAPYRIQWLTLLAGRTSQDKIFADQSFWNQQFRRWFESGKPFQEIDKFLGASSAIFQEWMSHPEPDAYWDSFNPTAEQYSRISMPILTITGIYDANQLGALTHYREHLKNCSSASRAEHYLIIGPWDHAGTRIPKSTFGGLTVGPSSLLDLPALHLQWYAWTMQGGVKPEFLKSNVMYYVMVAEEWRYADSLEQITETLEPYYLDSHSNPIDVLKSGSLSLKAPNHSESDHYIYDPRDTSLAELESEIDPTSLIDQRMVQAMTGRHLVYHSAPFEVDTEIGGFFKLSVWLAIDQLDTDFRVAVYEIAQDASSVLLTTDSMRARYRESLREQKLIRTREPLRYDFEGFTFVARRIAKGSRLRLVIGAINSIHSQKNYNSGGAVAQESMRDARPVTVRLFHDKAHPSALYVPLGKTKHDD